MADEATGGNKSNPLDYIVPGLGAVQTAIGLYESIKNSHKQVPEYSVTPQYQQAYQNAINASKYGYSGAENMAFNQGLSRNNATQYRLSQGQFGNQLSGAARAGINYGNLAALEQHFANSNSLMGAKIREAGRMAGEYQRISDMNTATKLNLYNKEQAAGGNLLNAGIGNVVNYATAAQYAKNLNGTTGGANTTIDPATGLPRTSTTMQSTGGTGYVAPINPNGVGLPKDQWLQQNRMLYGNGDPTFGDPNFGMNPNYIPRNY